MRKNFAKTSIAMLLVSITTAANPALAPLATVFQTAESLAALCGSEHYSDQARCEGYLMAVADEHFVFCHHPSGSVDGAFLRHVYLEYAEVRGYSDESRNVVFLMAKSAARDALKTTFHCN